MLDLTFGEQVKLILRRKNMTIKELAEQIEEKTGKKMSRQNLTQRLGRDNFQEQDMRMIAAILECPFRLSILEETEESILLTEEEQEVKNPSEEPGAEREERTTPEKTPEKETLQETQQEETEEEFERDVTVGELVDLPEETQEEKHERLMAELRSEMEAIEREGEERSREREEHVEQFEKPEKKSGWMSHLRFKRRRNNEPEKKEEEEVKEAEKESPQEEPAAEPQSTEQAPSQNYERLPEEIEEMLSEGDEEEDLERGDVNPYTGREYATNSVRMHPKRIGYVQVYNRKDHKWTDMTEWAFLGYQDRKKRLLGKDYEPPIYLD